MGSRLLSFVVWATVAASAVFWGLRLLTRAPGAPALAVPAQFSTTASSADLARLLGASPSAAPIIDASAPLPSAESRFRLHGVVAARNARTVAGLALISVDGKPARPFSVGAVLDGAMVLISVGHRAVEIGPRGGPAQIKLELAALPEAARSQLAPVRTTVQLPPPVAVPPPGVVPPTIDLPPGMVVAPNDELAPAASPEMTGQSRRAANMR